MNTRRSSVTQVAWLIILTFAFGVSSSLAAHLDGVASITLGATVTEGGCPADNTTNGVAPILRSKCEIIKGSAHASALDWEPGPVEATCTWTSEFTDGSCVVVDNTAECEVKDIIEIYDNVWEITVGKPKKSGHVSFKVTITGECLDASAEDPCDWTTSIATFEAVGTVQVVLPPEDEDEGCNSCKGSGGDQGQQGTAFVGTDYDGTNFRLNLGRSAPDRDAGYITLKASNPSPDLAKPVSLQVPFERPGVTVLPWTDGTIKQVKTPQGLIHIAVKDNYEYYLQCFYESSLTKNGSGAYMTTNGFYGTNSAAYVTWTIKNPDGGAPYNHLRLTEQRDSGSRTFEYTYTAASLRWDLLLPDGHTTISTWKVQDASDISGNTTNYFRQTSYDSEVVRKVQETCKFITALSDKVVTLRKEGDGGVTRFTTNTYYSSGASGGNANKLQRVDYPDGNWVYYKYDAAGRVETEYSAYGNNSPPNGTEPVPLTDNCKVTEYAYTLTSVTDGIDDDGAVMFRSPRRTIVKIPAAGTLGEVSRSYHYFEGDEYGAMVDEVRSFPTTDSNPSWNDAGYLSTVTSKYADGRLAWVATPDGMTTSYAYSEDDPSPGYLTTVVQRVSASGNGTETTTVVDEFGLPQTITTKAMVSGSPGITLSVETYEYQDGSSNYLDPLRRSYDVTDLAARKTQYRYNSCCGLDYVIDPDGVKTYVVQDGLLKQQLGTKQVLEVIGATERTIQITNVLDAVGSPLVTKRVGTNGAIITLEQIQYDVLGRVTRRTNALNNVTTNLYAVSSSRLLEITLNPDGGTITNTYYRDGRLESVTGTAVSGVKYVYGVEEDNSIWRQYTAEIKLGVNYAETSESTTNYFDGLGRPYKKVFARSTAPYPQEQSSYNDYGQLWKQVDPDGVTTLYVYNDQNEREYQILAVDGDTQAIGSYNDLVSGLSGIRSGSDRITRNERVLISATGGKPDLIQVNTYAWKDGESIGTLVSRSETSADGLKSWRTTYPDASTAVTSFSRMVYSTGGNRYLTNISPSGSYTLSHYATGRLASVTQRDSDHNQVTKTSYGYDPHGRQNTITDARNGTTTYAFNDADLVTSVTTPVPAGDQPAQTTLTYYDKMSRVTNTVSPDGGSVTNEYFPTGQLKKTYGSRTYPVAYTYDYAGRMATIKTWQDFANGSPTTTTWNYDAYRGWLANKRYADSKGPDYTYTPGGRLKTRAWSRLGTGGQPILTTYKYGFDDSTSDNQHGDLTETSYTYDPQSTPSVTTVYDRRGRPSSTTQGNMITALTYNDANQQLTESYSGSGAVLAGLSVTNGYDQFMRRTNLTALNGSTALARSTNNYDTAGRLATVSDGGSCSITYGYLANSRLVNTVTARQGATTRMVTTKNYDYLNRLTTISNSPIASGAVPITYSYNYNSANQRTRRNEVDGSYWSFEYDLLGQVKRGAKFFNDSSLVPGQQFEYAHDDIGNRTSTKAGGDENGLNLRLASYTQNDLNQYTSRTVPGAFDVIGLAMGNNSTLTVNTYAPWRKGEYFRKELSAANSSAPAWESVSVSAAGETAIAGKVFVPQTPEAFTYDFDGNLTQDGRWDYTWDAENRLVKMESRTGAPTGSKRRLEFAYDGRARRIWKKVTNLDISTVLSEEKFVYDRWSLIAKLDTSTAVLQSFLWGLDLSGTLQGTGGVGGLLAVNDTVNGVHFCGYEGSGNMSALIKAADGTVSANYDYGPFGEPLRSNGTIAKTNSFRFSTKYQDNESDFLYYGYRSCDPSQGRWLNRDPIEELGGLNLYAFSKNCSVCSIDYLGLSLDWKQPYVFPPLSNPVRIGPNPNDGYYAGQTDWYYFGPVTRVYQPLNDPSCPCGFKIYVGGYAQASVWWVKGDETTRQHEMTHVNVHYRNAFDAFKENAESKGSFCYSSKAKADCVAAVINGEMRTAYMNQAHAAGAEYDHQDYGGPLEPKQSDYVKSLEKLSAALARCNQIK